MPNKEEEHIVTLFTKAQMEFPKAFKSAENSFLGNSYATLDDGIEAVRPVLNKYGIALTQPCVRVPERTERKEDGTEVYYPPQDVVVTTLRYKDQVLQTEVPVIYKAGDCQSYGSGLTYARRYGLFGLTCCYSGEKDDDGNKAVGEDEVKAKVGKRSNYKKKAEDKQADEPFVKL